MKAHTLPFVPMCAEDTKEKGRDQQLDRPDTGQAKAAMWPRLRVVFAGGGTGGHLFPGIAMAEAFVARNPLNRILFISTGRALEKKALSSAGFELRCIAAEGIKGRRIWNKAMALIKIPWGVCQSVRMLKDFGVDLVIGLGSYSAGPVVMAAKIVGCPIVLHEQNILPGITNRYLARWADQIHVSFAKTRGFVSPEKIRVTGNPLRADIQRLASKFPGATDSQQAFTVLVIGGSQGAHAINMAVIEALAHLEAETDLAFIHQTGEQDWQTVNTAYKAHGLRATVQPFFNDMAFQYQKADLIICRAGATTVAEITAIGKAALFIPFPFAADNHQELNAKTLLDFDAAEMMRQADLDGAGLAQKIMYYASNLQALNQLALNAKKLGRPDAAEDIVTACYEMHANRLKTKKQTHMVNTNVS